MEKNLSTADRMVRVVASLVVVFFILNGTITGATGVVLGIVAIIFIATGVISFCPLYALLGISTRSKAEKSKVVA